MSDNGGGDDNALGHPIVKSWKYTISQSSKGARITVHGDDMTSTVNDYFELRQRLEVAGFKIAPED